LSAYHSYDRVDYMSLYFHFRYEITGNLASFPWVGHILLISL